MQIFKIRGKFAVDCAQTGGQVACKMGLRYNKIIHIRGKRPRKITPEGPERGLRAGFGLPQAALDGNRSNANADQIDRALLQ